MCRVFSSCQHIHVTRNKEIRAHLVVCPASLKYRPGIRELTFQKERKCSQVVKETTPAHDRLQLVIWQVLIKHQKIIAKVKESLARVLAPLLISSQY